MGQIVRKHVHSLRARLAAADWLMLAALLVGMLAVWGFLEIADGVAEGSTRRFDDWLILRLRHPDDPSRPIGPIWFEDAVRDLTSLGSISILTLVVGAVAGYLWIRRERFALAILFPATIGGLLASVALKAVFNRPRPDPSLRLATAYFSSFPSGHTMNSAVVYLTIGLILSRLMTSARLRAYFLVLAFFLTLVVGLTRIYLGVHYPTDVLAGWAAGVTWMVAVWLLIRRQRIPTNQQSDRSVSRTDIGPSPDGVESASMQDASSRRLG
ncbi:phosphatase PAP2 family protein [Aquisphaera insulae]|uniref:phosphatase PAP2 family protein n=1 Tax=Aquisphaera insulae TaxID=2712864 RepID=UPI0013EB574E|nr:phosphatase PAP2 family protein [Aquisphaera insulae]